MIWLIHSNILNLWSDIISVFIADMNETIEFVLVD